MVINRQQLVRVAVKPLQEFLNRVQRTMHLPEHSVAVCLVSDAAIARMNRAFRGKRGPTDVLSFPANGSEFRQARSVAGGRGKTPGQAAGTAAYWGDIAISVQAARRNAHCFARALPQELRVLILHGVLHLAGYDHETDHGEMDRLEQRLRRRLGLN
jgi:probable rRNA maturation factor